MKEFFKIIGRFFSSKFNRRLIYLVLIILAALVDFAAFGRSRRTFVFYTSLEGNTVIEDRMIRRSPFAEVNIRRYVEDALLGPGSQSCDPLLHRETRLESFLFRNGVVYASFSDEAAVPERGFEDFGGGGDVFTGFLTLNEGIRRNFSSVKDVKFFIDGNEIFLSEFSAFFAHYADNLIKPVIGH